MTIIQVIVVLVVVAVLLGLLNKFAGALFLNPTMLRLINAIAIGAVVVWLIILVLHAFGIA